MLHIYNKYKINNRNDFDKIMKIKYRYILDFLDSLKYNNIPNILIYGEEGSCKKTLIYNFFKNVEKNKKKIEYKINYKKINFFIYYTKYYIEFDIKQIIKYKKIVLIEFIKEINNTKNINNDLKIIIIHNINLLGLDEQFILRKIIEKNYKYCRFILISNTINNIIEPIKSRCFLIKTPGFTKSFIKQKLNEIIKKEDIEIDNQSLNKILEISNKNLKKALLELDFYLTLKNAKKEKEYIYIKKNNKEILITQYIEIIKKKYINYTELDDLLYKLLFEINIDIYTIIKYIYIMLEKNKYNHKYLNEIIDLNYEITLEILNNINKNKLIVFLQNYSYKLNKILN